MKMSSKPFLLLAMAALLFSGCATVMKGEVKEDVTLTEETQRLEELGRMYRGPLYTVAIIKFENRTPGRTVGVESAATDILRTIVKKAGLEPVVLTEAELREEERLMELQETGALRKGLKSPAGGFIPVDYRISGAVTSYSEVEEAMEAIVVQTKTQVARAQVDYALVDVEDGTSLLAESGMGEYRKTTGGLFGLGTRSTPDPALRDGALRDALTKAMTKMIEKLNEEPFRGRILAIEKDIIFIRAGRRSRLEPGAVFEVYRPGEELIDPETGRAVGRKQIRVGEIVLTSHQDEAVSEARVKSGSGFAAGDVIRTGGSR